MAEEHSTIDQLIINKPYDEPQEYWHYDTGRAAGFRGSRAAARPDT